MAFLADLEAWMCHKYGLTRDYFWNVGTIRERHRLKALHARLPTKVHFKTDTKSTTSIFELLHSCNLLSTCTSSLKLTSHGEKNTQEVFCIRLH